MQRALATLLIVTTGFEGLRAGSGTFRALLDLPARREIGAVAFAALSRATDLSTAGIIFYVLYGVGGPLFTGTTLLVALRMKADRYRVGLSATSVLCSVLILALTVPAAPLMWRIGSAPDDNEQLSRLIEPFVFWTNLRIGLADLSFLALLAAAWQAIQQNPRH